MKKKLFLVCVSLVWTVALMAQQIAVVSTSGTKVFRTLQEAIEGADPGSVIYLPGGGFALPDDVRITKKLIIYGIGHKIQTENPDGYTTINGNIFFDKDSDGSALMGCYVTGTVRIGEDGNKVDDVLIRCNNLFELCVHNNKCQGTDINQNYIRSNAYFNEASARFTNNVADCVHNLDDGVVSDNIIVGITDDWRADNKAIYACDRTIITNNIILLDRIHSGDNCSASGNMCLADWGVGFINVSGEGFDWKNVFVDYQGVTPNSDFHFKEEYKQYEGKVGINHGNFSDDQLAPIPYIVRKIIPEHTDAEGKLNIKIRVKAGE